MSTIFFSVKRYLKLKPEKRQQVFKLATAKSAHGLEIDQEKLHQIIEELSPEQGKKLRLPREKWPLWARVVALKAVPEDTGVGDTIHRTVGEKKSEAFAKWHLETFGRPCKCAERRALWNAKFPYDRGVAEGAT